MQLIAKFMPNPVGILCSVGLKMFGFDFIRATGMAVKKPEAW